MEKNDDKVKPSQTLEMLIWFHDELMNYFFFNFNIFVLKAKIIIFPSTQLPGWYLSKISEMHCLIVSGIAKCIVGRFHKIILLLPENKCRTWASWKMMIDSPSSLMDKPDYFDITGVSLLCNCFGPEGVFFTSGLCF